MTKQCFCGMDSKKLQCKKQTENKGRFFYCCGAKNPCKFFQWHDIRASGIKCNCNKDVEKRKCTKNTDNYGRFFYSCFDCNFFIWAKETAEDEEERRRDIFQHATDVQPVVYPQSVDEINKILKECENNQIYYPEAPRNCTGEKRYTASQYRMENYPPFVFKDGFKVLL
jgi:hypothetical protein